MEAIVTCCDQNMLPAACVALLTAARFSQKHAPQLYVVIQDMTPDDAQGVRQFCKKHRVKISAINFPSTENCGRNSDPGNITNACYLPIHLDQILPADLSRVIYLDCDIMVQDDISELFEFDFGGLSLAAVIDGSTNKALATFLSQIGLSKGNNYLNSGVLIYNWPEILKNKFLARARALALEGRYFKFPDQDIFNIIFAGAWLPLNKKYNATILIMIGMWGRTVSHFAGVPKPWWTNYLIAF